MIFWWVTVLLLLVALATWATAYWNRRVFHRPPKRVANSEFLDHLPSFRAAERRAQIGRILVIALALCGVVAGSLLSGRIATEQVKTPEFANRDIVLCLDVSGSMYEYDTQILSTFAEMVSSFEGERVALSIFNSTSRTVFPLTNDYSLIQRELEKGSEAIDFDEFGYRLGTRDYPEEKVRAYTDFVQGTQGITGEASIVPDGLASCGMLFDQAEADRSRSIIFATDNEVNGEPIFSLDEAAGRIDDRGIDLYTFYPGAFECSERCFDELKTVTESIDGEVFQSTDPDAIPSIIQQIQATQAVKMGVSPSVIRTDQPLFGFVLSLLAAISLVLVGWWSRR